MFIDSMRAIIAFKRKQKHQGNKMSWLTCVSCFYIHVTITPQSHFIHSFIYSVNNY